jgi:hypothetical protein
MEIGQTVYEYIDDDGVVYVVPSEKKKMFEKKHSCV